MNSVLPSPSSVAGSARRATRHVRIAFRCSRSMRCTAWLVGFTLLYLFYNWVSQSYMLTEDYDPFRFYRLAIEPFSEFDIINRDVFTILLLKSTYIESLSLIALPVLLALVLARVEQINRSGRFLFPLIASPALPYLVQTGKDGLYLVFLILLLTAWTAHRLRAKENILYVAIIGALVLLTKEAATLFGLALIYLIGPTQKGLARPLLLSALIGSVSAILFLELPDIDALNEYSNIQGGLLSTLTVTQSIGLSYPIEAVFRSIGYFLYTFISPVIWISKCLERQDLSLSLEALSSIAFLWRLAMLESSRRNELLRQMAILSTLLGFSYFFLHFRYLSVFLGLLVICEIVRFQLAVRPARPRVRRPTRGIPTREASHT